jgi:hypothetical protein
MTAAQKTLEERIDEMERELEEKLHNRYVPLFYELPKVKLTSGKWTFIIERCKHPIEGRPSYWWVSGVFFGKKNRQNSYFWNKQNKRFQKNTDGISQPKIDECLWMIVTQEELEEFYEYAQFNVPQTTSEA